MSVQWVTITNKSQFAMNLYLMPERGTSLTLEVLFTLSM